jgi:hypothetical protein
MSAFTAISSITERLVELVKKGQNDPSLKVTATPPDKVFTPQSSGNLINVFLYQSAINAAWRNQDLPKPSGKGQPARPLLPLTLYYLISASGSDAEALQTGDLSAHRFLGRAMLTLHYHPVLAFAANSGVMNQTDPIRVTLQPLNLDEMSKLWSAFQTPYRPSVAYEVGVVLIESETAPPEPLPVVRRGERGTGWDSTTQFPATLSSIHFRTKNQPGMRLGETITLVGQNLHQPGTLRIVFRHRLLADPLILVADRLGNNEIEVTIPDVPDEWPAGTYMVAVQNDIGTAQNPRRFQSNALPIALLPEILVPDGSSLTVAHAGDDRTLVIPCKPDLLPGQRVQLLVGSVLFDALDIADPANPEAHWQKSKVTFPTQELPPRPETPFARLRVDGVDSLLYDPATPRAEFDTRFIVKDLP